MARFRASLLGAAAAALVLSTAACGSANGAASTTTTAGGGATTTSSPGAATTTTTIPSGPLVVVGWGGLSDTASQLFSNSFTKATTVQVKFDDNAGGQVAGVEAQSAAGSIQWDVGDALGQDQADEMAQKGLLQPLPANVSAELNKLMPGAVLPYGIKYGTLSNVIACNSALVARCPTTPQEFFDVKDYPGTRTLYGYDPLGALALATAAEGVPYKSIFPINITKAFAMLDKIKPDIKVFYQSGDQSEQLFRTGEVAMGILWNGRAYDLATHPTSQLKVKTSWNGAPYEPSVEVVVKGTPHLQAAYDYLEWIAAHPQIAARYSTLTTYGFPSQKSLAAVPPALAKWLPEYPANFSQRIDLDYAWYVAHLKQITTLWNNYIS